MLPSRAPQTRQNCRPGCAVDRCCALVDLPPRRGLPFETKERCRIR